MKNGMDLGQLLTEVQRQSTARRDFVATTDEAYRMVPMPDWKDDPVAIVLKRDDSTVLERFRITDHCHRQIAGRLQIPWKYYHRLLEDHTDMVIDQVNALFEREPARRLLRTMDGYARGFLSDRYLRIDNDYLLANTLPPIVKGDLETTLLSSNVGRDGHLSLKVLFTDPSLEIDLGPTAKGDATDKVRPGFRMDNDEVGRGKSKIRGFFFRDYCTNGCVWGQEDAFEFSRTHLGGRLIDNVDYEILSDASKALEDKTIISQITDVMHALADREFHVKLSEQLRSVKETKKLEEPMAAMKQLAKDVSLSESETTSAIQNLLVDNDFTQWGAVNAITKVANNVDEYERANELESIGAQVLQMNRNSWLQYAELHEAA